MIKNNEFLEKGFYNRPQTANSLTLKQYIVVREKGKRCLIFRFLNETGITVKGMQYLLVQLDGQGQEIARNKIRLKSLRIAPEETYATDKGVAIKENCADFIVTVLHVYSGAYRYSYTGGKAVAHYDTRGFEEGEAKGKEFFTVPAQSEKREGIRFFRKTAFLVFALLFLVIAIFIIRAQNKFGKFDETHLSASQTQTAEMQIVTKGEGRIC